MILTPVASYALGCRRLAHLGPGGGLDGLFMDGLRHLCLLAIPGSLAGTDCYMGARPPGQARAACLAQAGHGLRHFVGSSLGLSIYAYSTARNIQIEQVVINTAKLPVGQNQLKIAMTCDLHLSPAYGSGAP